MCLIKSHPQLKVNPHRRTMPFDSFHRVVCHWSVNAKKVSLGNDCANSAAEVNVEVTLQLSKLTKKKYCEGLMNSETCFFLIRSNSLDRISSLYACRLSHSLSRYSRIVFWVCFSFCVWLLSATLSIYFATIAHSSDESFDNKQWRDLLRKAVSWGICLTKKISKKYRSKKIITY